MSRAAAVSNERLRSKNELRASRTAGWELERKRFERLPFSILEPSRPALCETISAVDRPRRVRFKRNLRGLATVRAHRIKHLTRAAGVAAASAPSTAPVSVHSLPTVRPLVGRTSRREGPRLLKLCTTAPSRRLTGRGAQRPKLMRNAGASTGVAIVFDPRSFDMLTLFKVNHWPGSRTPPWPGKYFRIVLRT